MSEEHAVAGRLDVLVEANLRGFKEKLRAAVEKDSAGVDAQVGVDLDTDGLREKVDAAVEEAGAGQKVTVEVDVDEQDDTARSRLKQTLDKWAAKLKSIKVKTETDNKLPASLERDIALAKALAEMESVDVPIRGSDATINRDVLAAIVKGRIEAAAAGGIKIPVGLDDSSGGKGGSGGFLMSLLNPSGSGPAVSTILRGGLYAGIASLIQPVVGSLVAGVAGLAQMAASLSPAVGVLAGIGPIFASIIGGALGTTMAVKPAAQAIALMAKKEQVLASGGKWSAAQQAQLTAALQKLSPAARKVVKEVFSLHGAWSKMRKEVEADFFKPLIGKIKPLGDTLLPTLTKGLGGAAAAVGTLAGKFADWFATPAFNSQAGRVFASNNKLLGNMGDALFYGAKGALAFLDAARPFTAVMGKNIAEFGKWFNSKMQAGNRSGGIADWLQTATDRAKLLWGMTKHLAHGLYEVFHAGDDTGMDLLTKMSNWLTAWDDWASSGKGQRSIKQWFATIKPTVVQLGRLIRDTTNGLLGWANDPKLAGMVRSIRKKLGPALSEFFQTMGTELGPSTVNLLSSVVGLLSKLGGTAAALAKVADALTVIVRQVNGLVSNKDGSTNVLGKVLGNLLGAYGIYRIFRLNKLLAKAGAFEKGGMLARIFGTGAEGAKIAANAEKAAGAASKLGGKVGMLGKLSKFKAVRGIGWITAIIQGIQTAQYLESAYHFGDDMGGRLLEGYKHGLTSNEAKAAVDKSFRGLIKGGDKSYSVADALWGDGEDASKGFKTFHINMQRLRREMQTMGTASPYFAQVKKQMEDVSNSFKTGAIADITSWVPGFDPKGEQARRVLHMIDTFGNQIDSSIKKRLTSEQNSIDLAKVLHFKLPKGSTPLTDALVKAAKQGVESARRILQNSGFDMSKLIPKNPTPPGGNPFNWFKRPDPVKTPKGGVMSWFKPGEVPKPKTDKWKQTFLTDLPAAVRKGVGKVKTTSKSLGKVNFAPPAHPFVGFTKNLTSVTKKAATSSKQVRKSVHQMFTASIPGAAGKSLTTKLTKPLNQAAKASQKASRTVNNSFKTIGRTAPPSFGAVSKAAQTNFPKVRQAAQTAMKGTVSAISKAKGPAGSASKGVANSTLKPMNGLHGQMSSAGSFAMAGLAAGIRTSGGQAVAEAQRIAAQINTAVRSTMKIKSPSRVMIENGQFIGKGLAKGVAATARMVAKATAAMTKPLRKDTTAADHAKATKQAQDGETKNDAKFARAKERNNKRLAAAERKLSNLKGKRNDLVSGLKSSFQDFSGLQGITDSMGGYASPTAIIATLRGRLKQSRQYRDDLAALRKKGLDKTLYKQLLQMGVEAGAPVVAQLKNATPKQLKQIAALQKKINGIGSTLAKKAGKQMYGAGIRAAQGLVDSLKHHKKELEKIGKSLGEGAVKGAQAAAGGTKHGHAQHHRAVTSEHRTARHATAGRGYDDGGAAPLVGEFNQYVYGKNDEDAGRELLRGLRRARMGGAHAH